jgi:hypothetical protein
MDTYQQLSSINESKQKSIDDIKNISKTLDRAEDTLREKIILRYQELDTLKREFNNIIETYSNIIRSSVKQPSAMERHM